MTINKNIAEKWVDVSSVLLILLFVYAAVSKLMNIPAFLQQIHLSPLIPDGTHKLVVYTIPLTELAISGALCFKKTRKAALYASYFLMLLFTLYLYCLLQYSTYIPCSCGGILGKMSWNTHILFNLAFSVMAGIACIFEERLTGQNIPRLQLKNSVS